MQYQGGALCNPKQLIRGSRACSCTSTVHAYWCGGSCKELFADSESTEYMRVIIDSVREVGLGLDAGTIHQSMKLGVGGLNAQPYVEPGYG